MQELHLPDGKTVAVNPELIAYLHPLGEHATQIGFGGGATLTVEGGYDDVLVQLGLLDHAHGDDDATEEPEQMAEQPEEEPDPRAAERALRDKPSLF